MTAPRDPIEAPRGFVDGMYHLTGPEYSAALRRAYLDGKAAARDEGRQEAVREIRGRLWESAWRIDEREWLHPQTTSDILDDVARHGRSSDPTEDEPGAYEIDDGERVWRFAGRFSDPTEADDAN